MSKEQRREPRGEGKISAEKRAQVQAVVEKMSAVRPSKDDPNGSYTGIPVVPGETPVQDADDL